MITQKKIDSMEDAYGLSKAARIGETISCPTCKKSFIKKTKDHAFCSNGRSNGAGNCKDGYWNRVNPEKRCRNTPYFKNVICGPKETPGWPLGVDEGPEGWDGHKD